MLLHTTITTVQKTSYDKKCLQSPCPDIICIPENFRNRKKRWQQHTVSKTLARNSVYALVTNSQWILPPENRIIPDKTVARQTHNPDIASVKQ